MSDNTDLMQTLTLAVPNPVWAAPLVNPPLQRGAHSSAWKMQLRNKFALAMQVLQQHKQSKGYSTHSTFWSAV